MGTGRSVIAQRKVDVRPTSTWLALQCQVGGEQSVGSRLVPALTSFPSFSPFPRQVTPSESARATPLDAKWASGAATSVPSRTRTWQRCKSTSPNGTSLDSSASGRRPLGTVTSRRAGTHRVTKAATFRSLRADDRCLSGAVAVMDSSCSSPIRKTRTTSRRSPLSSAKRTTKTTNAAQLPPRSEKHSCRRPSATMLQRKADDAEKPGRVRAGFSDRSRIFFDVKDQPSVICERRQCRSVVL